MRNFQNENISDSKNVKVLFLSRDLTHHLVPFFKSLFRYYGEDNCVFAVTEPTTYRHNMGFPDYQESWVFEIYNNSDEEYIELWNDADIIITRVWDRLELVDDALKKGKLVFYASERWFKPTIGMGRLLIPSYLKRFLRYRGLSRYSNFYYLAMGYYASSDFSVMGICKRRIFSFGYFTPSYYSKISECVSNQKVRVLWAGRLLGWKRVIDILKVYKELKNQVQLTIIGDGPTNRELHDYALSNQLSEIIFHKFVQNEELKQIMAVTDIYILPSSGYEGWGAVINEAMQTKCAVIAAQETGAARSMIIDGKNGLLFHSGNTKELKEKLKMLLDNKRLMDLLKEEGYKTITETWSAEEAARRFSIIVDRIKQGQPIDYFKDGPMQILG